MKKIYITVLLLFSYACIMACDYCNCYLGLDPGYNKNTIGLRTNWRTAEWIPPVSGLRLTHNTHSVEGVSGNETLEESFVAVEGDDASHSEFISAELRFRMASFVTRVTPKEEST